MEIKEQILDTKRDNRQETRHESASPDLVPGLSRSTSGESVQRASRLFRYSYLLVGLVLLATSAALIMTKRAPRKTPTALGASEAPAVSVARAGREDLFQELTIPAEFRPYFQVDVHAKVSGFVQDIKVDIGDRVKAGQLLAQLEVPELKAELDAAIAAEQRAQAEYKAAHLAYTRLADVLRAHPNLVAQQELDSAEARDHTAEAGVSAAKAGVERYQTLMGYTRILAPFEGVITHRYADPGSLIQAGTASDTQSLPLVRLSDNYRLRLDIPVSVSNVKDITLGQTVGVQVDSLGKTFTGTIARSTQKVDEQTRTMTTEVEVDNPNLELVPGMYASVVLKVAPRTQTLTIATEAVSPDRKGTMLVVNGNNEIEQRAVTFGVETSTRCEVIEGLKEGELVVIGGHAQLKPGQKVTPKLTTTLARQ